LKSSVVLILQMNLSFFEMLEYTSMDCIFKI
jgi:hypothetical protein